MKIRLVGSNKLKIMIEKISSDFFITQYDDYDILVWHLGEFNNIKKDSIVLFNSDENRINIKEKVYLISYGHSLKDTITISSMENGCIMICIQRTIIDIYGNKIEPQEFQVKYKNADDNSSEILALCSFALVCAIPISKIQDFMF